MAKKITKKQPLEQPKPGKRLLSWLFFFPIALSFFGLFFVYEASSIHSLKNYGDSFHYLKLQAIWVTVGILLMLFFSILNYKKLATISVPLMLVTIGLLIAVLIPGIGRIGGGARSWISLGSFNLQPTELAKFSVIIYLASWFVYKEKTRFRSFLVLLGVLMGLIILQPDIGTAIMIFGLTTMIYFLAGKDFYKLLIFIPIGGAAFFYLITSAPYRFNRLISFMHPERDPLGISYQINQILISISGGGLFGKGFGASRQKYLFLPEAHTDSVFAIIGEEFGFIGGSLLIFIYVTLIYMLYRVYTTVHDGFARLLVGGIMIYFALQIIVNLGGMVSIMPLTGVPLPFISYGGSNILISFILMGMTINIVRQSNRTQQKTK